MLSYVHPFISMWGVSLPFTILLFHICEVSLSCTGLETVLQLLFQNMYPSFINLEHFFPEQ